MEDLKLSISELAKRIDHAIVKPDATWQDVKQGCLEARELGLRGICVPPCYVGRALELLEGSGVRLCAVVGFPFGFDLPEAKALEARRAVELGADDVDMVINISALRSGLYDLVLEDLSRVVEAAREGGAIVKAIVEACYLSEEELRAACELALRAGVDFIKTSTGFGPSGASVEVVRMIRSIVGSRAGIKASGGIRTYEQAMSMIEAGADLIGTSTPRAILGGARPR
ncbi:MAG TPA: deoxyribose-phosphate aldolase [Candidatus Bathyarchaeota archaeon]|nr:deoxyribose-phosphate aldolase [Candidatus Bathyarchaeota archaeon]